jgi:hypothetical protein
VVVEMVKQSKDTSFFFFFRSFIYQGFQDALISAYCALTLVPGWLSVKSQPLTFWD